MCGIIGITKTKADKEPIGKQIYEALSRLEYRGYDSVGMAVVNQDGILLAKDSGAIKEVGQKLDFQSYTGQTAIGHSRWATHGPPVQRNAHPHKSMDGRVVVIHNGIIENYLSIKKELEAKGVEFQSDTDTEVVPNLLEQELKQGKTMEEAIDILVNRIEGTFALVISTTAEPNRIYALRRDNPLVVGITEDAMFCASDVPAFLPWTREVLILRDEELAILEPGSLKIKNTKTGKIIKRRSHEVTWDAEAAQKGGFPHFMQKEIHEQSKTLQTQLRTQSDIFEEAAKMVSKADKIITVAAGTAYYASLTAYHSFPKYGSSVVLPCISAEWDTVAPLVDERTLVLAVSQSGETLDTIKAIKDAKQSGAAILSVVNVTGSTLTQISDLTIYIHAGPEIGVAATKTFTNQSYAVWRIGYALAKRNATLSDAKLSEFEQAINSIPSAVSKVIRKTEAQARDLSKWFAEKSSAFYLGRGISQITAFEGALKMKEISYIHAEGYPAGESKHGPIALVEQDYPVVFTIPRDRTREKMMGSVQEMAARGATTIGVIEEGDEEMIEVLDHYFEIPKGYSEFLSTIIYTIPQQLLAYYTSVNRGFDPDRPRNLAKSVTVE